MDTAIHTTQVVGLTSSLVLGGINLGASNLTLLILYTRHPSSSTPIFNDLYTPGASSLAPLCLFSTYCLRTASNPGSSPPTPWVIASAATFAQLPWTLLVMYNTNKKLNAIASSKTQQEKASKEEVAGLLRQWAWMNFIRGLWAVAGGCIGVWALVEQQT